MYLSEILDLAEELKEKYGEDFDPEIEVHFQPNYPLKGSLENVRILNGKLALAAGAGTEYGDNKAWQCEWEDNEDGEE